MIIGCCVLLAAFSGCLKNKYAADLVSPLDANAETGLVILSLGSQESCQAWLNAATFVHIYKANDSFFRVEEAALDVNGSMRDTESDDHHGHLHVLKLPLGSYYLTPFKATGAAFFLGYWRRPEHILKCMPMKQHIWVSFIWPTSVTINLSSSFETKKKET